MVSRKELDNYCNKYLNVDAFKDYCPNGLQIEGAENITNIVSGVSANLALIERAIDENADAIFVHHGIFLAGRRSSHCWRKTSKGLLATVS